MNKTKILTSLSALAAVFVFNGNALAGKYNPRCDANVYSITVMYTGIGSVTPSQGEQCRSGEICIPSCPSNNYNYSYTYGDSEVYNAPAANCSGSHTYNGWKLQGVSVKVNGQTVSFPEVAIAADAEIKDEYFFVNGKAVDTGSTFKLVPADVSAKTVSVRLQCTFDGDNLPSNIVPTDITHGGGNVGAKISFANNCKASGYTINQWQYQLDGDDKWSIINGNEFTIPEIDDDAASVTYVFKPVLYVPKTYDMVLRKDLDGAKTHLTLKYTNPVENNAGTWMDEDGDVDSVELPPLLLGYTLRGMVKSDSAIAFVTSDSDRLGGNVILRSSVDSYTSAALPNLGVVTTDGTFYPAYAKNCEPVETDAGIPTASCKLTLTPTTGAVTYTNACEPGFNTLK